MFHFRWLHNGLDVARSRKPVRLMLESLEERLTPSGGNPTMTQTAGGYTALTSAIKSDTAVNTNYVIEITNSFTFNAGEQVSISQLGTGSTLTIEGQNGNNFTLTGNGNRLFTVGSGQNVTLADLTLTGGAVTPSNGTAQGGAMEDLGGNVTLSKMVVQGNTAKGGTAEGGGVYAIGAGTLVIRDSVLGDNSAQGGRGADGSAPGSNGGSGGSAYGGGLYVGGGDWTVMLTGDTFSGNTAIGGNGGNGAAGSNATAPNTRGGNGGGGGGSGQAGGGAAYFSGGNGSCRLTILNDLRAPIADPSTWIDNSAQAGAGGNGGAGGVSTGNAPGTLGGFIGGAGEALGGALSVTGFGGASINGSIGNSTFYGNKAAGGKLGAEGAPGKGGVPPPLPPPLPRPGGDADGGGLFIGDSVATLTMVNSTVAQNTATGGAGTLGGQGFASGGGMFDVAATTLDNNTIAQNTVDGEGYTLYPPFRTGGPFFVPANSAGVFVEGTSTLINNLIQGNQSVNASPLDLNTNGALGTLAKASNNFVGSVPDNSVSTTTNIIGNSQMQSGSVVGVDSTGKPTAGPIYYPLLPGAASIGAGSISVLNTIAGVEGTTAANATDEIGDPLSINGAINLGAIQIPTPPPPSPPSPLPPPPPSSLALTSLQLMGAIALDVDALVFQDFPPIVSFLNAISEQIVGQPLPPTADLIPTIEGDFAALVAILFRDVQG